MRVSQRQLCIGTGHVVPEPGVIPNGPLVEVTSIGMHETRFEDI
jgi:hypothetical protein